MSLKGGVDSAATSKLLSAPVKISEDTRKLGQYTGIAENSNDLLMLTNTTI